MPYKADVFRIMLSGPGDTVQERAVAAKVIDDWNHENSYATNTVLLSTQWEMDAMPAMGDHPQALLNKQLVNTSDAVIAIFNLRLGSETPRHASGTAEEIAEFATQGKEVHVYFYGGPIPQANRTDPQFERLEEFKNHIRSRGIQFSFDDSEQLERLLRNHLTRLAYVLREKATPGAASDQEIVIIDEFWRHAMATNVQWEALIKRDGSRSRAAEVLDSHRETLLRLLPIGQLSDNPPLRRDLIAQYSEVESLVEELSGDNTLSTLDTRRLWLTGHSLTLRSLEIAQYLRRGEPTYVLGSPTIAERFRSAGVLYPRVRWMRGPASPERLPIEAQFYNSGLDNMDITAIRLKYPNAGMEDSLNERIQLAPRENWNLQLKISPTQELEAYRPMFLEIDYLDSDGKHVASFCWKHMPTEPGAISLPQIVKARELERMMSPDWGLPLSLSSIETSDGSLAD